MKDRTETGANGVRVVEIRSGVSHDYGRDAGRVGGAHDGAKIARLFHMLQHTDHRLGRERQLLQGRVRLGSHQHDTLTAISERQFPKHLARHQRRFHATCRGLHGQLLELLCGEQRLTHEQLPGVGRFRTARDTSRAIRRR